MLLEGVVPPAAPTPYASLHPRWREDTKIGDEVTVWGHSAEEHYTAPQKFERRISGFSERHGRIGLDGDVNSGDSGAPVVNIDEKVIGIVQGKDEERDGQFIAIPISFLLDLLTAKGIDPFQSGRSNTASIAFIQEASTPRFPLQRPSRADHFTDREHELFQLLVDLQPGHVVTLCGPGGIGKSALAAEAVWKLAPNEDPPERFPDGVIFHNFYKQPQAALALEHIIRSFGNEEPRPTLAAAAQRVLASRQALVILDGTEQTDDLREVLAVRGNCGILITSRRRKDAAVNRQDMPPLELDEAVALLQAWAGARAANIDAARHVCGLVGCLPLAVRLIGHYLAAQEQDVTEYQPWLERTPLAALNLGQRQQESVTLLLERSLSQVSDEARQTLAAVGLLASAPFSREVIATALEAPAEEVGQRLGELVNYSLILRGEQRYQISHALVHTYVRQRHVPPREVLKRIVSYYIAFVKEQSALEAEGFQQLDAEREHIMLALNNCIRQEEWEATLQLVWAVERYFQYQGHWTNLQTAVELGLTASQVLDDKAEKANCIKALGDVHRMLAEYEPARARYEQAQAIYAQIGDRYSYAANSAYLGLTYRKLGQAAQARQCLTEGLKIFEEIKSPNADLVRKWLDELEDND